jgi:hypothetical protein
MILVGQFDTSRTTGNGGWRREEGGGRREEGGGRDGGMEEGVF